MNTLARQTYDIVIAGAGPAGATLAILMAKAGWQTLLLDAARFPRGKVCGECLGAAALPVLREIGLESLVLQAARVQRRIRIMSPGGGSLELALRNDGTENVLGISRRTLDWLLLQEAQRCGVRVLEGTRVRRVLLDDGRVCGVSLSREQGRDSSTIPCRVLVAADGRSSMVVRQTGIVRARGPRLVGFKCHRRASASSVCSDAVDMVSFAGGYLGRCTVEEGDQNICGLMPRAAVCQARGSITAALTGLLRKHDLHDVLDPGNQWLTMPDVRLQRATPHVEGVLYVGDAMGTIEPLAGQGLSMAIEGAQLAAELLADVHDHTIARSLQRCYTDQWHRRFRRTVAHAAVLGWLLRHPRVLQSLVRLAPVSHTLEEFVVRACYRATRAAKTSATGRARNAFSPVS